MVNWNRVFGGIGAIFGIWLISIIVQFVNREMFEIKDIMGSLGWIELSGILTGISLILSGIFSRPHNTPHS